MEGLSRRTLRTTVSRRGVGVHVGVLGAARLRPAPFGKGIVFRSGRRLVPATVAFASGEGHSVLGPVATVEHLLAALTALGVTDALVDVEGPELPILDGSAWPWVEAVCEAGLVSGPEAPVRRVVVDREIDVGGARVRFVPAQRLEIAIDVRYDDGDPPSGRFETIVDAETFTERLARARTYVRARDLERLRREARGCGATEANTFIVDAHAGAPVQEEAVRHKALDLVGDLALFGSPLHGRIEVERPCHARNRAAVGIALRSGITRLELGGY